MWHQGDLLLRIYNDSISAAILDTFPSHRWKLWKFSKVPSYYWKDLSAQLHGSDDTLSQQAKEELSQYFHEILSPHYQIVSPMQWFKLNESDLRLSTKTMSTFFGGWKRLLAIVYPHVAESFKANPRLGPATTQELMGTFVQTQLADLIPIPTTPSTMSSRRRRPNR